MNSEERKGKSYYEKKTNKEEFKSFHLKALSSDSNENY